MVKAQSGYMTGAEWCVIGAEWIYDRCSVVLYRIVAEWIHDRCRVEQFRIVTEWISNRCRVWYGEGKAYIRFSNRC